MTDTDTATLIWAVFRESACSRASSARRDKSVKYWVNEHKSQKGNQLLPLILLPPYSFGGNLTA